MFLFFRDRNSVHSTPTTPKRYTHAPFHLSRNTVALVAGSHVSSKLVVFFVMGNLNTADTSRESVTSNAWRKLYASREKLPFIGNALQL
jgi:hypothetical protein